MVREDILNWLKAAISRGENANDAAMRLITAGHDMYEVNDALRQITFEIADKKFAVSSPNEEKKEPVRKPQPPQEVQELPKTEVRGRKGFFSGKSVIFWIWAVMILITLSAAALVYFMSI